MTYRERAQAHVRYYTRLSKRHPDDAEGVIGQRLAEKWLALIDAPDPEPAQIAELLQDADRLEKTGNVGSGVVDMNMGIHAWARSKQSSSRG